uniref:RING-type domain-containing protein n=1 Tax=Poecilia reticulata TaxID=8081 RepID=A0A3P9MYX9_POERE
MACHTPILPTEICVQASSLIHCSNTFRSESLLLRAEMEQRIVLDQSNFSCSICLDLLKDPVTIPCGHSYCKNYVFMCPSSSTHVWTSLQHVIHDAHL